MQPPPPLHHHQHFPRPSPPPTPNNNNAAPVMMMSIQTSTSFDSSGAAAVVAGGASSAAVSYRTPLSGSTTTTPNDATSTSSSRGRAGYNSAARPLSSSSTTSSSGSMLFKRPPPRHPTPGSTAAAGSSALRHSAAAAAVGTTPRTSRSLPTTPTHHHHQVASSSSSSSSRGRTFGNSACGGSDVTACPATPTSNRSRSPSPFRFKLPPASPSSSSSFRGSSPSSPAAVLTISAGLVPAASTAATGTMEGAAAAATSTTAHLHAPDLSLSNESVAAAAVEATSAAVASSSVEPNGSPAAQVDDTGATATDADNVHQYGGDLPEGWIELVDPSTGATYYYHEHEQRTTWERPMAAPVVVSASRENAVVDGAVEVESAASIISLTPTSPPLKAAPVAPEQDAVVEETSVPDSYPPPLVEATDAATIPEVAEGISDGTSAEPSPPSDGVVDHSPRVTDDEGIVASSAAAVPPPLPDGWQECYDASSGQTYYFHEDTNVTQWDRPSSDERSDIETEVSTKDAATEEMKIDVDDMIHGGNEAVVNPQESAPSETLDSSSSVTPLTATTSAVGTDHEDDDGAHWDDDEYRVPPADSQPLSSLMNEPMIATPLGQGSTPAPLPPALPAGWEELMDESSGQVYYYHAEKGLTSWERPQDEAPEEVVAQEPDAVVKPFTDDGLNAISPQHSEVESPRKQEDFVMEPNGTDNSGTDAESSPESRGATTDSLVSTTPVETTESLPDGWVEVVDETSGQVYYYNMHDNTTSWERPNVPNSENEAHQLREDRSTDLPASGAEVTVPSSDDNESLPEGWQELRDTTSGRVYYYHEADDVTTWEKPVGVAQRTAERVVDTGEWQESPESESKSHDTVSEAIVTEPSHISDTEISARKETTPTQSSELETSEGLEVLSPNPVVAAGGTDDVASSGERQGLNAPLPEGWEEVVDEANGTVYYYNSIDGTTTWSRPGSETMAALSAEGQDDQFSVQPATQDPGVVDDSGGAENSFRHRDLQEEKVDDIGSSFDRSSPIEDHRQDNTHPVSDSLHPISDSGIAADDSHGLTDVVDDNASLRERIVLPDGWEEVVDEDSGAVYYYNAETDTASWDVPAAVAPAPVAPENDHEVDKYKESPELTVETEPEEHQPSSLSPPEGDELPAGWEELVDESTGQVYYFCEESGISQWDRPRNASISDPPFAAPFDEAEGQMMPSSEPESAPEQTASELPTGWVETTDEASGLPIYVSEDGTRTWDRPVQGGSSEHPDVPQQSSSTQSVEVPPEWTEATDDANADASEPLNVAATDDEVRAGGSLPPGWVELVDPATSRPYFLNENTNETSWDRPAMIVESQDDLLLSDGWEEVVDESTGQAYYYNAQTGESSWDRPASSSSGIKTVHDASRETPRRPVQAIATFGFGGRLCIISSGSPIVTIKRTGTVVAGSAVLESETVKAESNICGPVRAADANSVISYISRRSARFEDHRGLLWQMVATAFQSNGKLRSDRPADDPQSPESAVARLLLNLTQSSERNGGEFVHRRSASGQSDARDADLHAVFRLLVEGKKEDAAKDAAQSGCFALSLVLASMCGPRVFEQAIANYAHAELAEGSPLFTAVVLFSGQVEPSRSTWGTDTHRLRSSWQYHLLAILSVRSKGWDLFAVSLGDTLKSIGESEAAHVCYLVCGCPLASPARMDSRYTLLGVDVASTDLMLSSDDAVLAYELTEAYEMARLSGGPSASIDCLQPFKLAYARLLADFGLETAAANYVKDLKSALRSNVIASSQDAPCEPLFYTILSCDKASLSSAVSAFESRLSKGVATDGRVGVRDTLRDRRLETNQVATKVQGTLSENGAPPARGKPSTNGAKASVPLAPPAFSFNATDNGSHSRQISEVPDLASFQPRAKSPDARSPVTAPPPVASTPKPVGSEFSSSFQTPSVSKPPPEDDTSTISKPKSAPMSAPANLQQSSSTPASSGKKKGFFSFGIRDKMTKWLNPDATQADLGEGMQAYYDEKRKVWVFPGEDPDEVAKPIGPPPTTPQAASASSTTTSPAPTATTTTAAAANDPLAALMVVPNRAPSNFQNKSKSVGAAPNPPPGMILMMPPGAGVAAGVGGGVAAGSSTTSNDPNAGGSNPKVSLMMPPPFAVFTPGPSAATTTAAS